MPSGRHHRRWFCTEVTGSSIWHRTTQVNALSHRCRPAPSPASSLAGVTQERACHMCDQAAALSRGVVALRTQWRHHHGDVASHHQWEHAQHKLAAHAPHRGEPPLRSFACTPPLADASIAALAQAPEKHRTQMGFGFEERLAWSFDQAKSAIDRQFMMNGQD
jgi:hypothetical protein